MHSVLKRILFLGIGGFAGSNARYWISLLMIRLTGGNNFPFGTLTVNAAGCLLLGLLAGGAAPSRLAPELRLLMGTGFLGALTTFSTFSVETVELFQNGNQLQAFINTALNLGIGFAAAALGLYLAQRNI